MKTFTILINILIVGGTLLFLGWGIGTMPHINLWLKLPLGIVYGCYFLRCFAAEAFLSFVERCGIRPIAIPGGYRIKITDPEVFKQHLTAWRAAVAITNAKD